MHPGLRLALMLMGMVTKDREEQGVGRRVGMEGREYKLQRHPVDNSIGQGRSDRSCGE